MIRSWLTRRALAVALVAAMPLMVACGEANRADDARESTTTSGEPGTTTSSTWDSRRQEAVDAFVAAAEAFNEAAGRPDPAYPLDDTHTGPMLEQSRAIVEGLAADGLVLEYPPESQRSQTVISVDLRSDAVAILAVCTVDDGRRVRQDTGQVVVGGGVSTVWADVAMERVDSTWKLAERRETDRQNGEAACDGEG